MKFSNIDKSVDHSDAFLASIKFNALVVELAVSTYNWHVGSGLGGNNFQLLTLMSMRHELSSRDINLEVKKGVIYWGDDFLIVNSLAAIRKALNAVFPQIRERFKYSALVMESLQKSNSFKQSYADNKSSFPKVEKALTDYSYANAKFLSMHEQLIFCNLLCIRLSEELDRKNLDNVKSVGFVLMDFPCEIVLMAVRQFIGLERIIPHNVDEDPVFGKVIAKIAACVFVQ